MIVPRNGMLIRLAVYKKTSLFALTLLVISILGGCARTLPPPIPDNKGSATGIVVGATAGAAISSFSGIITAPVGAAMGGVVGGAVGHYLSMRDTLFTELDRGHLQIFKVGREYMVLLPADSYFFPDATHVNESFYPTLNALAEFIKKYETEVIKVAGFTDSIGHPVRNVALSRQQAQNILNYLWNKGLDTRMMYSIGYGEQFPIANNDNPDGRAANRRVQITFREIPKEAV